VLQQNDHFHEQILLLALEGASDDLFALMTRPASEKTRSDGALVAGTARTDLASAANFGNVEVCCLHHFSISSDVDDRQRNTAGDLNGGAPAPKATAAARRLIFVGGGGVAKKTGGGGAPARRRALAYVSLTLSSLLHI